MAKRTQPDESNLPRQLGGSLAGAAIGVTLAIFFTMLSERFGIAALVLWGAVIGGVLSNLRDFMRAGAVITHSQNRWLNLSIGLGLPAILLVLLCIGIRSLGR